MNSLVYSVENLPVTSVSLDVDLAVTGTRVGVTSWGVGVRPLLAAATRFAAERSKVIEVVVTAVTFVSCHARLALAPTLAVALQTAGT